MKSFSVEGLVLKRRSVGEYDRFITLFTKTHGKLNILAKGIRKIGSRRSGSMELFNQVKVSLTENLNGFLLLGEVDLINAHAGWKEHLGRINLAYQLSEIVDKLSPEGSAQPEAYNLLNTYFSSLHTLGGDWEVVFATWASSLLESMGYWDGNNIPMGKIVSQIEEITMQKFNSAKLLERLRVNRDIKTPAGGS